MIILHYRQFLVALLFADLPSLSPFISCTRMLEVMVWIRPWKMFFLPNQMRMCTQNHGSCLFWLHSFRGQCRAVACPEMQAGGWLGGKSTRYRAQICFATPTHNCVRKHATLNSCHCVKRSRVVWFARL